MSKKNHHLSHLDILLVLGVYLVLISCNDRSKSKRLYITKKDPLSQLTIHNDLKYKFLIETQSDIILDINQQKIETNNSAEIGMTYLFQKISDTSYQLKMTYDTFYIASKKNGTTDELTSSNKSSNIVEKLLWSLKGSPVIITLGKHNKIVNIEGQEEIRRKLQDGMSTLDAQTSKAIQNSINKIAGENFIKNAVGESLNFLPDSTIHVGDTWVKKSIGLDEVQYNASTNYKLESYEEGLGLVTSKTIIESDGNNRINLQGTDVGLHLSGEQNGEYKVEGTTGIVMDSHNITTAKGTLEILGKEANIKIKIKRTIAGKKI